MLDITPKNVDHTSQNQLQEIVRVLKIVWKKSLEEIRVVSL
jgi:hypothetical protein